MIKRLLIITLAIAGILPASAQEASEMDRIELCKENYRALFGGDALTGQGTDPELMDILQKFIFGEVFRTGDLDMKSREMITCVCLATMQTLPQLKGHAEAALNVGVTPLELREAIYQCAPYIGYPRTLNAVGVINEIFKERGISLPLEIQSTVTESTRHVEGAKIQISLYGDKIKKDMKSLPGGMDKVIPDFLTEACFGDYYTRKTLDVKTRELLSLCVLVTLGTEKQLASHISGNIKAGNPKERLYAAMIQCLPYIGFPNALSAITIIKDVKD